MQAIYVSKYIQVQCTWLQVKSVQVELASGIFTISPQRCVLRTCQTGALCPPGTTMQSISTVTFIS